MEELKRIQRSTFDTISMRKLIEDRDIIHELTATIQELQKDVNRMNDSSVFSFSDDVDGLAHKVGPVCLLHSNCTAEGSMLFTIERLPDGLAVSASSHLISSHLRAW